MLSVLLSPIEYQINCALKQDAVALRKMASLRSQVIQIDCSDWEQTLFIFPHESGLQFETSYGGKVDTIISGTLNHFLHLFFRGTNSKTLFQYPVHISGNLQNIDILRDVFQNLDFDFEEKLSHFLGDGIAHRIVFHTRETKKQIQKALKTLKQNAQEFIYFESKSFPTRKMTERFYESVSVLRDDVERAEMRINQLIQHRQHRD